MPSIEPLADEFMQLKCIAVSGVKRSQEDAANLIYRNFKARGVKVFAINPNTETFDGDPCYPNLAALPEKPEGVVIVNRAEIALQVLKDCAALGVPYVWTHCSMGSSPWPFLKNAAPQLGRASEEMVALAREHGIKLIPGACPNMFFDNPRDGAHRFMRGLLKITGALKTE